MGRINWTCLVFISITVSLTEANVVKYPHQDPDNYYAFKCNKPTGNHLVVDSACLPSGNEKCTVSCQTGFELHDASVPVAGGQKVINCINTNNWGVLPTCQSAFKCNKPTGNNLVVDSACFAFGNRKCTVSCQLGFALFDASVAVPGGRKEIECTDPYMDWGVLLTCKDQRCEDINVETGRPWSEGCDATKKEVCVPHNRETPSCRCATGFAKDVRGICRARRCSDPVDPLTPWEPTWSQLCQSVDSKKECKSSPDLGPRCVCKKGFKDESGTCEAINSCAGRSTEDPSKSWTQFCRNQNRECAEEGDSIFCGSCLEGFQEDPRYNHTCTAESSSTCPNLFAPLGGLVAGDCKGATVGGKCLFTCETGKTLVGQGILTCQQNGTWNFQAPTCTGYTVEDRQRQYQKGHGSDLDGGVRDGN